MPDGKPVSVSRSSAVLGSGHPSGSTKPVRETPLHMLLSFLKPRREDAGLLHGTGVLEESRVFI